MPLPMIDLENTSNQLLNELISKGACLIHLPEAIQDNLDLIKKTSDRFFEQPLAIKKQEQKTVDNLQGYINQSELGYDIERYISRGLTSKDPSMNTIQQNLNETRSYFREDILKPLIFKVLSHLGIAEQQFKHYFSDFDNTLSIIHYPAQADQADRLPAHNDGALITALWAPQPGLEILLDDIWHKAETPTGYIIVQLGDGLAEWTNHQTKPLTHRVNVYPNKARTAIASFCVLDNKAPFNNLVDDTIISPTFGEYIFAHIKQTYQPR